MKKAKKVLALLLAFCMILSTNVALGYAIESNIFAGVSQDEANMTVTLTSVIYKDNVPVTTVNPGDEVVARVFVNVSEPTPGMEMIVVWDSDAYREYDSNKQIAIKCFFVSGVGHGHIAKLVIISQNRDTGARCIKFGIGVCIWGVGFIFMFCRTAYFDICVWCDIDWIGHRLFVPFHQCDDSQRRQQYP